MTKNVLLVTCATGALSVWAGQSQAATATASAAATSQGASSVTEIVVTAEKREQSLQKIPVAVSVFTGAQRDTIGISSVADVTNFAPGFTYDPQTVHAYLRGVGRQSVNVTDDQRVSNYEDEFYVYSPYGLVKSSLFLSQTQIERGPQNVGGRNAAAGSIDMLSVRPTDHPYAELRATLGNFGTYIVEGAVSNEVAPGLSVRLAGFWNVQNEGYYTNVLGGPSEGHVIHEWYGEGQVDWKPNDKFEFWARGFYEGWNNRGDAGSKVGFFGGSWDETVFTDPNVYVAAGLFVNPNYGFSAPGGNPTAFAARNAFNAGVFAANPGAPCPLCLVDPIPTSVTLVKPGLLNNPSAVNPNTFAAETPRKVVLTNYADFNFIATYHFNGFDVKYNAGVQGYNYYLNDPGDGPGEGTNVKSFTLFALPGVQPLVINPQITANYVEDDIWTAHDLTVQSTSDSPFQWTVGGFGYYQHYNQPYTVEDTNQPQLTHPICAVTCGIPAGAPANLPNYFLYLDYKFNVESLGGYAQASYKINDQLKVTGDLRYSWDKKWGTENSRYLFFGSALLDADIGFGFPLYSLLGVNTPSEDITWVLSCFTGNGVSNAATPGTCLAGPLAKGVKSKGFIEPNGMAHRDLSITSDAVTGGAEIQYQPTPDIFTYFRYGRGYESPSFNAGQNIAFPEVGPEFLNAYEVGYKQTFGKTLIVNLAAFYYDYIGLQVPLSINNGGVVQGLFVNVPKSVSEGVEVEAYWTPIRDFTVTFSYSYDHTEVLTDCKGTIVGGALVAAPGSLCLEDTNDPGAVEPGAKPFPGQTTAVRLESVKGDPLPNAPANKVAVDAAYTWHFEPGDLTFSASLAWRDKQLATLFNRFYDTAPSWYDVDLRALWRGPKDKYEVIAFVKNLTDTLQYTVAGGGAGLAGSATCVCQNETNAYELNPPRTYGVEVRYKFF